MLGADDDSESDGKASLEEPFVDTDVEISSGEEKNDDGEDEAKEDGAEGPDEHQEEVHEQHAEDRRRARGIARPTLPTKAQLERHYLEGHSNYFAGCEFCARCRCRAEEHFQRDKRSKEYLEGE